MIEIGKEGQNIFIDNGISPVRKLLHSTDEFYQYLVDKEHPKLFPVDKDKISIFQAWYQDYSRKNFTLEEVEIMDNLTETELNHFFNIYIGQQTHNKPLH